MNSRVQYFDMSTGIAKFKVLIGDRQLGEWAANANLPWKTPNGDTSTREEIDDVSLHTGEKIRDCRQR